MSEASDRYPSPVGLEGLTQEESRQFADAIDSLEPFFVRDSIHISFSDEEIDSQPPGTELTGVYDALEVSLPEGKRAWIYRDSVRESHTEGEEKIVPTRWTLIVETPYRSYGERAQPQRGSFQDFRNLMKSIIGEALDITDPDQYKAAAEILSDFGLMPDDLDEPVVTEVQTYEVTNYYGELFSGADRNFTEINPSTGRKSTLQTDSQEKLSYIATQHLPESDPQRIEAERKYTIWLTQWDALKRMNGDTEFTIEKLQDVEKILAEIKKQLATSSE